MNFISPLTAAIAAGITIPSLVLLYFLKLKRKRMVIPSTLLWQRAVQDMQVNSPFQKIKNNLLLWIQLLLLIALLIAMARPTQNALADPGQRVVIVIDHSASMNTKDASTGDTRLEQARDRALRMVDDIAQSDEDGGASVMVISFSHQAQVLQDFTTDLAQVRRAIRDIERTDQLSHLGAALSTIEPLARQGDPETEALSVHIFTDGRVQHEEPLALINAELKYHRIGDVDPASVNNVAIVAMRARRDFERPQLVAIFARLANYGSTQVETNVTLRINGDSARVERVTLPPAELAGPGEDVGRPGVVGVTFDLTWPEGARVEVSHDHRDALAVDDIARLMLVASREMRVLLVTQGNAHIERAINATQIKELVTMSPSQFAQEDPQAMRHAGAEDAAQGFDVIVFDRYSPEVVPLVPSLYFHAVPPIEGFGRRDAREDAPVNELIVQWDRSSELLASVELSDIPLRRPGRLVVPSDGHVLATGREGPVMAEVTRDGVRHVVVSFDVYESLWWLRVSFPTFFKNAMPVLGLGSVSERSGLQYQTGENAVLLLDAEAESVAFTGPAMLRGRVIGKSVTLDAFPRVGLYTTRSAVGPRDKELAVNLLDQSESDIRVVEVLKVGTSAVAGEAQAVEIRTEVWPWFVWGALALLAIEWLVYVRRMHI